MKEEALKLADELDALHQYVPSEAPAMIRRLVEELDRLDYDLKSLAKRYKALDKTKPLDRTEVYGLAIESGFMLSTQHGQAEHKLMPVTDGDTLMVLVKAIEERHGIK